MIQIREYGRITCNTDQSSSPDLGIVTQPTFDWLLSLKASWRGSNNPIHLMNKSSIKLDSYVGYLESPTGESIEVLPKTCVGIPTKKQLGSGRTLLHKMLLTSMGIKPREVGPASLLRVDQPLHEWVIGQFLNELAELVRKGISSDYKNIEEESRYVRGCIDMSRQLRQRAGRANWFHIRHDVFSPEIIENQLLATALSYVRRVVKSPDNWRLANELSLVLDEIPTLATPDKHLDKWRSGKLMRSYDVIQPWCRLIIERLNPVFQKGKHKGVALLFPMERLFETYVATVLKRQLGSKLKTQASSQYLVSHQPTSASVSSLWFQLKPDLLFQSEYSTYVMDTKWKLLDEMASDTENKYKVSQSDLYQLFAYGHKYQNGKGNMMLIYPKHDEFRLPLAKFSFSDDLNLWVVPFDMEKESLVEGEWIMSMPELASKAFERLQFQNHG